MIKSNELVDGLNDVSNEIYHADRKYLSSSVLKVLYKSLEDYHDQYILGNKKQFGNENALSEGSLTHAELLEPDQVKNDFIFFEGLRKAGADWEKFKAGLDPAAARKTIISKPQRLRVASYIEAFKRRPEAVEMLKGGQPEQTICGNYCPFDTVEYDEDGNPINVAPIKVRFDYINVDKGIIYDVKTTAYPADFESFKQTLKGLSYELSAALYLSMAEQYYGKPFKFKFIVISKKDPQDCQIYRLSEATRAEGQSMIETACAKYLSAKQSGIWKENVNNSQFSLTNDAPNDNLNVSAYEILEV